MILFSRQGKIRLTKWFHSVPGSPSSILFQLQIFLQIRRERRYQETLWTQSSKESQKCQISLILWAWKWCTKDMHLCTFAAESIRTKMNSRSVSKEKRLWNIFLGVGSNPSICWNFGQVFWIRVRVGYHLQFRKSVFCYWRVFTSWTASGIQQKEGRLSNPFIMK